MNHFFQLPAFYLVHPWLTTLLLPWTNLICTDYVDSGKCQDRFGRFSGFKNDSKYLDVKHDNKAFRLIQNLTMGESDFNHIIRLRHQLLNAAESLGREENLSSVLIPTISEDMDEQLKLAHKLIDVVDQTCKKICVTLLWYNVEKPEISSAQVRLFAKTEEEKFQQIVCEL